MDKFEPDFKKAYCIANDVLICSHTIETIPFDIEKYIKDETDIALRKYHLTNKKYGVTIPNLGSDDALIIEKRGRYIVFYDEYASMPRRKWSIVHELGHYYLGHNLDFESISPELYAKQEIEAHYFAAQLLMPDQVIFALAKRCSLKISSTFLQNHFAISKEAACKRLETLNKRFDYRFAQLENDYDDLIVLKFDSFIKSLKPKGYYDYSFEDEEEMQKERDSWNNRRFR